MDGVPQLMWQCPQHTVQDPNTVSDPRDHLEKGLLQKEGQPPKGGWENGLRKAMEV